MTLTIHPLAFAKQLQSYPLQKQVNFHPKISNGVHLVSSDTSRGKDDGGTSRNKNPGESLLA